MKAKKIMTVLVIAIMLIGIVSVPVLASTNEKVILKNSDNEYLIYFKEFCKKEFQFAISKDSKTAEADLNFVNSAKDQPASAAGTLNVAYIDEASFENIFGKNPPSGICGKNLQLRKHRSWARIESKPTAKIAKFCILRALPLIQSTRLLEIRLWADFPVKNGAFCMLLCVKSSRNFYFRKQIFTRFKNFLAA